MSYFRRFLPGPAIRDLRQFLSHRSGHELLFAVIAVFMTSMILVGFVIDSHAERPYKREIIYFDNWNASRTDAEIIAKQKIDQIAIDKRKAEIEAAKEKRKAEFKKVDDAMERWGL